MKLSAKKMGSIKAVKDSLKKGGSGGGGMTYIKNVPADGITIRFLTEPEDWFGYYEYYDAEAKNFVPMAEGEILPDGARPSFRYLANALDVETDRVIPLKLAKTAANVLILKYDKYDTMMDRNYELQRHGEGLDTTYDVTPDAPSKMNLAKYDLLDLEAILLAARAQATGEALEPSVPASDDDDDEDVVEVAPAKATKGSGAKYDEAVLFPGGDFRTDYSKDELGVMTEQDIAGLLEWWEIEGDDDPIANILAVQDEYGESDDDEDEAEESESEESDDDADEDDDDEEVYDEESLRAMPIRSLRQIAADMDIEVPAKTDKDTLIDLIIEAAES